MIILGVIMLCTTVVALAIVNQIGKIAIPLVNALERLCDNLEAFVDSKSDNRGADVIGIHDRTDTNGPDHAL